MCFFSIGKKGPDVNAKGFMAPQSIFPLGEDKCLTADVYSMDFSNKTIIQLFGSIQFSSVQFSSVHFNIFCKSVLCQRPL